MHISRAVLFGMLLSAAGSTLAHHSFIATYDPSRSTEISGVVAEYKLRSPHSFILLDVESDDGGVERFEVEMASLPMMRRRGFDENTFEPGDEITVIAWPHRTSSLPLVFGTGVVNQDGATVVSGEHLTLGDANSPAQEAIGAAKLAGRWLAPFPDVGPESPLSLTPAGLIARENYNPKLSPANTCEPNSVPAVFHSPYLFEIQITPQEAVVHHEAYNVTRTVPLNSEPRRAEPSGIFGVVAGRIEGDELVIESSDYPASGWGLGVAGTTNGAGADVPSSAQKELIERYSVSADGRKLTVSYTVEDPIYLTEPFSNSVELTRVANDAPMYEYACELDNAATFSRDR